MRYQPNLYSREFLVLLIIIFCISCSNDEGNQKTEFVEEPAKMDEVVSQKLKNIVNNAFSEKGRVDDSIKLSVYKTVSEVYKSNNYSRIWSKEENLLPVADSMLQFIKNARYSGLFPEDYHHRELQSVYKRFASDSTGTGDRKDAVLWTKTDLMLTDAFLNIARHLHSGRLRPDSIYKSRDSSLPHNFFRQLLSTAVEKNQITTVLSQLEPVHGGYHELKKSIPGFLDSAILNTTYTYLNYPYKDSAAFVQTLIRRLKEEGVVPWQTQSLDSTELRTYILQVQKKKGLKADGRFGLQLVTELNNNDPEKFYRIAINLDRYKMMPVEMPKRYIWVNLPGYYLKVLDSDTVRLESKVIVGTPKTRTPLLSSEINNMVTYPQWTIPNSIIVKEILPALKKNPGYLAKKGYMLVTWEGEPVDPYVVEWSKYNKGIPYKVVQGSGDANALGILKFNFPNSYSVYLHDTNQRYLFKKESRALSHGCVRVQEWKKLAWYISELDSVNAETKTTIYTPADSIEAWLTRKEKHVIPVKTKLPVYFRYFTAEGRNGRLVFFNDIYGEDRIARTAFFPQK
jgi:L,D-transpeptidase YcbB